VTNSMFHLKLHALLRAESQEHPSPIRDSSCSLSWALSFSSLPHLPCAPRRARNATAAAGRGRIELSGFLREFWRAPAV
jgi:hypothetical protein